MHPYLFGIVPAYPVALGLAVTGSAVIGALGLRRIGVPLAVCVRVQLGMAAAGLLGAKLYSLIARGGSTWPLAQELTQGYRYPGALIGVAIGLALARWLARGVSLGAIGDALAPSVGVGAALLRVGCFLAGCCYGVPSALPWAVRFPSGSPPWHAHLGAGWIGSDSNLSLAVHPLQLYFIAVSLAAAALAWWLQPRRRFTGQVLLAFLMTDAAGKAVLESLRQTSPPGVQIGSLVIALAAGLAMLAGISNARAAQPSVAPRSA